MTPNSFAERFGLRLRAARLNTGYRNSLAVSADRNNWPVLGRPGVPRFWPEIYFVWQLYSAALRMSFLVCAIGCTRVSRSVLAGIRPLLKIPLRLRLARSRLHRTPTEWETNHGADVSGLEGGAALLRRLPGDTLSLGISRPLPAAATAWPAPRRLGKGGRLVPRWPPSESVSNRVRRVATQEMLRSWLIRRGRSVPAPSSECVDDRPDDH